MLDIKYQTELETKTKVVHKNENLGFNDLSQVGLKHKS